MRQLLGLYLGLDGFRRLSSSFVGRDSGARAERLGLLLVNCRDRILPRGFGAPLFRLERGFRTHGAPALAARDCGGAQRCQDGCSRG
jgi:hypothetical protein